MGTSLFNLRWFCLACPLSPSFLYCPSSTLDSSFLLSTPSLAPLCLFALAVSLLRPLPDSLRGQPGRTVRLATSCFSLPFLFFLLSFYFPSLLSPLLPSFFSASLSPASSYPLKVIAQSGPPNVAAPYVAFTQRGRLPPCRALFALAPPMIFSHLHAPFLCAAYGPGANYVAGG